MAKLIHCLNVMRRMDPNSIENDISGLLTLVPDLTEDLLQRIDQPLEEAIDPLNGRTYLKCDYNRDGDSYRSPWSNEYDPKIMEEDGYLPSDTLRQLEMTANELFDHYRQMYYTGGVSSVYLWDLEPGFAGCFLIKKDVKGAQYVKNGSWHSIHVVEVQEDAVQHATTYKLTTTILLTMDVEKVQLGTTNLAGNVTRQCENTITNPKGSDPSIHLTNIGKMIEDMEIDLRSNLDVVYIGKTHEILNGIRQLNDPGPSTSMFLGELAGAVKRHGNK